MSSKRASMVAAAAFALGIGFLAFACNNDDDHPPATSSGGSFSSSGATGGSSSGTGTDGSTTDTRTTSSSGTTSSGGSSGSSGDAAVDPHLTATIDGTAAKYDVAPTAKRQIVDGSVIVVSGSDAAGNKITVRIAKATAVTTGNYACVGDAAAPGANITYATAGGVQPYETISTCSVTVTQISNQVGAKIEGTFNGTAELGASTKVITFGDFSLTLE